jgi:hypothetical protein
MNTSRHAPVKLLEFVGLIHILDLAAFLRLASVTDNLWHNRAVWHIEAVSDIMSAVAHWPLKFGAGQISVYRNPRV